MNLYSYARDNPVNFTDPSGLASASAVVIGHRVNRIQWDYFQAAVRDFMRGSTAFSGEAPAASAIPLPGPNAVTPCAGDEENCGVVTGRQSHPIRSVFISGALGILGPLADWLEPPLERQPQEDYWQCVGRVSGGSANVAFGGVGLASIGAGGAWLGYPRGTLAGGGQGSSLISYAARGSIGNVPMGRQVFGTGNFGGAVGRGISRASVAGGAAAVGWSVGSFVGALQRCQ